MRFMQIRPLDVSNGEGIRTTIFLSGCEHYCKGCFNQDYWDFNCGEYVDDTVINTLMSHLESSHIKGLSILGGEPMHPRNVEVTATLIASLRYHYKYTKDIWLWTGYTYGELKSRECTFTKYILSELDIMVDGKFEEENKDLTLKFRGSSNQRLIDMQVTRFANYLTLYHK